MFEARPPAKINLTLAVGARRPDGYHDLRSVVLRIGLADSLSVTAATGRDTLAVSGLPCPVEGNLVLRAFDLLRRAGGVGLPGLAANLDKRIPVGAGLGGGSADAAAALLLAAAAWGVGVSQQRLAELALALGSDVPFFAAGLPAAVVEGRGEMVSPLPTVAGGAGVLLAMSGEALSTAAVYDRFDELRAARGEAEPTSALAGALRRGMSGAALAEAAEGLRDANDLWPAAVALRPELSERRTVLERVTARPWLASGSGPTLFALYPSVPEAVADGRRLAHGRPAALGGVMLCATDLEGPDAAWRERWPSEQ